MALRVRTLRAAAQFSTGAPSLTSQVHRAAAVINLTGSPHDATQQYHSGHREPLHLEAFPLRRYSHSRLAENEATAVPQRWEEQKSREVGKKVVRPVLGRPSINGGKDENVRTVSRKIDWESLSVEEVARLKRLQVEYEVWKSQGYNVPDEMSDDRWLILMKYDSEDYRRRLCAHWLRADIRSLQHQEMQQQEEEHWKQILLKPHPAGIQDAVNTYIDFDRTSIIDSYCRYNNLVYAAMHGLPLVFDMSFEKQMTASEVIVLAHKVKVAVNSVNCFSQDPFHLHFSGVVPGSNTHKALCVALPQFDYLPVTVTEDSYLGHYPKEDLVYLSAKSSHMLADFNPNDVYIIGGIADNISWKKPLSYKKAREEGSAHSKVSTGFIFQVSRLESRPLYLLMAKFCLQLEC